MVFLRISGMLYESEVFPELIFQSFSSCSNFFVYFILELSLSYYLQKRGPFFIYKGYRVDANRT